MLVRLEYAKTNTFQNISKWRWKKVKQNFGFQNWNYKKSYQQLDSNFNQLYRICSCGCPCSEKNFEIQKYQRPQQVHSQTQKQHQNHIGKTSWEVLDRSRVFKQPIRRETVNQMKKTYQFYISNSATIHNFNRVQQISHRFAQIPQKLCFSNYNMQIMLSALIIYSLQMQETQNQQLQDPKSSKTNTKNLQQKSSQRSISSGHFSRVQAESYTLNIIQNKARDRYKQIKAIPTTKDSSKTAFCNGCNSIFRLTTGDSNEICEKCTNFNFNRRGNTVKKQFKDIPTLRSTHNGKFSTSCEPLKERQIWQVDQVPSQRFLKQHPEYCKDGFIAFPVQDCLFNLYEDVLKPFRFSSDTVKFTALPQYFQSLLQIWNILKTFPSYFQTTRESLTIQHVQQLILNDEEFLQLISKVLGIFVKEYTNEKNEFIKKSKYFDFFSLLKFCSENGLLERVYRRCWSIISLTLLELLCEGNSSEYNLEISNLLQELSAKNVENCPPNLYIRCKTLAFLTSLLTETNQFRMMITQRVDDEKKQHKKSLQLEQKKKKLLKQIAKVNEQEKSALKEEKNTSKSKPPQKTVSGHGRMAQNNLHSEIEYIKTEKAELLMKFEQIQEQMKLEQDIKTHLTHVEYLGQDKDRNMYWNILTLPDKIFVNCNGKWSFMQSKDIKQFIDALNLRGVRENCLYRALSTYINSDSFKKGSQSQSKNQFLAYVPDALKIQSESDRFSKNAVDQQIRILLTESQQKLTAYLDERNSRWGTETERENFLIMVQDLHKLTIPVILEGLRNLNEKICVVETQYRRINQQSAQEIDTKTRKVQTKIWGISQKYKSHWTQYSMNVQFFPGLFFLIKVLCLNIQKYASKHRKKRKEFEFVKETSKYFKTLSCRKDQLSWEETCETCREGGSLLCCDMCPKVFHLSCLDIPEAPQNKFLCEDCQKGRNIRKLLRKSKA